MLQQQKRTGAALCVLPLRPSGLVNLDALCTALRMAGQAGGRCVVALTHMNTDSALLQPAAAVGALTREQGAVFLLDACQTIGQVTPRALVIPRAADLALPSVPSSFLYIGS